MGPLAVKALFEQSFETAPESVKFALAPGAKIWFTDALAQLNCLVDDCDDLQARKDVAQEILDIIEPYIVPDGGGGGGS